MRHPRPGGSRRKMKLRVVIVTVSTSKYGKKTRNEEVDDQSGSSAERLIEKAGHVVSQRFLIPDDATMLRARAAAFLSGEDDLVIFVGGTGVSPDDITIETVRPYLEKEFEGFGETLRRMSFPRIGAPAFLTRATAGTAGGKLVVCLPGSPDAVEAGLQAFVDQFPLAIERARTHSSAQAENLAGARGRGPWGRNNS